MFALMEAMKSPSSSLDKSLRLAREPRDQEDKDGVFWNYWSVPKPSNLATWIQQLYGSKQMISTQQLQTIYSECHPMNSGFYLVWLTEEAELNVGTEIDLMWKLKSIPLQYRVVLSCGSEPEEDKLCPDGSHRVKLSLQNSHCEPMEGSAGTWWAATSVEDLRAYIVPFQNGMKPSQVDHCFFDMEDINLRKEWRCGPGTQLTKKTLQKLLNDAECNEAQIWNY